MLKLSPYLELSILFELVIYRLHKEPVLFMFEIQLEFMDRDDTRPPRGAIWVMLTEYQFDNYK